MAGAEPPRGPETELSEGRQGAAEAFGGGFWPGFLDEVAKDFFFFPGFHRWPQGAGPSIRSVWPILGAFSRGREAEGHVAREAVNCTGYTATNPRRNCPGSGCRLQT